MHIMATRVPVKTYAAYLGIWPVGVTGAGAGAGVVTAAAGAAGVAGTDCGMVAGTGAVTAARSITPPLTAPSRLVAYPARTSVVVKKMAAATPVDLDMKLDEPVAPNRLPEAPEPKAAPMSAPLPCWSNTSAIIVNAEITCTTTTIFCNEFISIPFQV